jgi:hypothetical protein
MRRRWWQSILFAALLVTLVTPGLLAQQSPAPGVTVQKTVTTDSQGNTVIVERTFQAGVLIKMEEKTFNAQGQLIRQVEQTFVGGQLVKVESVVVANGTTTKVERIFQNGQLVKEERIVLNAQGQIQLKVETVFDPATGLPVRMEEETVALQNGTLVKTEREFRLVNGMLTEVAREVETIMTVDGQRVEIKQEFELRGGMLVLVEQERKVLNVNADDANDHHDGDNHGGGGDDGGGGHH